MINRESIFDTGADRLYRLPEQSLLVSDNEDDLDDLAGNVSKYRDHLKYEEVIKPNM